MDNKKIRTRFAPSPTGFLHIGNLRTVLFEYLTAKSLKGDFILRIEDTDQKREVKGAVEKLIDVLDWVGIKFDEGPHVGGAYGPYIQTERLDVYKKFTQQLIDKGEAYYCFCTEERLAKMREEQEAMKKPPRYDRCCRDISIEEANKRIANGEKYVVRQKMPLSGKFTFHEELRGDLEFNAEELDDHVLIKSDGVPTYHFASVVDDHLMEITHVLRGSEWLPSFPKNALLYRSFGWEAPKFYHLSLIMNKEGGKLSKRQGDVAVEDFRKKGYLKEGLINFMLLLGWHPEGDNEIISLSEAEKLFKPENIGVSPAIFDIEKLDFFNGYHIRQKGLDELVDLCRPYLSDNLGLTSREDKKGDEFLKRVIFLSRERLKKLSEISEQTRYFFTEKLEFDPAMLVWRKSDAAGAKSALSDLKLVIEGIPEDCFSFGLDELAGVGSIENGKAVVNPNVAKIQDIIMEYLQKNEKGTGDYLWPMRVALTGEKASPSPFEMAWALGKEETISKITNAISKL